MAETTKPARDYLNVKIPQLLEKVRQIRCSVGASQHNPCYSLELRKKNVNQQIIELNYLVLDWRASITKLSFFITSLSFKCKVKSK